MKKPVILLYSLLLLGLIFLPTYIFGTDVFKVNAQQRLAAAAFTHKDEVDPCVETSSAVSIFKTVSQQPSEFREALDYALVFITKRNVCTDQTLVSALGLHYFKKRNSRSRQI